MQKIYSPKDIERWRKEWDKYDKVDYILIGIMTTLIFAMFILSAYQDKPID